MAEYYFETNCNIKCFFFACALFLPMHFVLDLDIQNVDLPAERKEKKDLPAVDKTGEGDYKITLPFLGGTNADV